MNDKWEEVPDEDLWEDGELSPGEVQYKIIKNVLETGNWKLVRRREWNPIDAKKKHKQTPTVL
tara:strand:- start:127 stop:315 length:189 start_codon:yes stop_codon:yes gene_type:complete